jgi:hypothetical protein
MTALFIVMWFLFSFATVFFVGWLIGYPIYRKVTHQTVFAGSNYATGLCIAALVINLCNLVIQIVTRS